jgi:ribosomal protein S18 acetylase RimI-like enzyme
MRPSIHVRVFEPLDIAGARSLWQRTDGVGLSEADEPGALATFLARNPGTNFVALDGDAIVGTILCGHDGRRGLIHHLAVAPACRRQGIARELLRMGLTALADAGIQKCHLLVFKTNESGKAFWRLVGAEERVTLALFSIAT